MENPSVSLIKDQVIIEQPVLDIHPGIRMDPMFWVKVDEVARLLYEQIDPHEMWERTEREERTMYHKIVIHVLHEFNAIYVDLDNPGRMLEE